MADPFLGTALQVLSLLKGVYDAFQQAKAMSKECSDLSDRLEKLSGLVNSLSGSDNVFLQEPIRRSIADIQKCASTINSWILTYNAAAEKKGMAGLFEKAKKIAFSSSDHEELQKFNVEVDRVTVDLIAAMGAQGLKTMSNIDRNLQQMHSDLLTSSHNMHSDIIQSSQITQVAVGAVSMKQDQVLDKQDQLLESQKFMTKMLLEGSMTDSGKRSSFPQVSPQEARSQGDTLRLKLQWTEAFEFYRFAATQNDDQAAAWCSYAYLEGLISPADVQEAYKFASLSHRLSNPFGTACYGACLLKGWGVAQPDITEAPKYIMRSHNSGCTYACVLLGEMFYEGKGFAQSFVDSAKYFRLAADKNDPQAQYRLGTMFLKGDGLPSDPQQALHYLTESRKHGHTRALSALADLHFNGSAGLPSNKAEAFKLYAEAAKSKDLNAQVAAFRMLRYGDGVKRDLFAAFSYCKQAADEHGRQDMQFELARMLWRSIGCERDVQNAMMYFNLAAGKGSNSIALSSMVFLGLIAQEFGTATGKSAVQWWSQAMSPASPVTAFSTINAITLRTKLPWAQITNNPQILAGLTEPLEFVPALPLGAPFSFQRKFVLKNGLQFIHLELLESCSWAIRFQQKCHYGAGALSLAVCHLKTPVYLDILSPDQMKWQALAITSQDEQGKPTWGYVPTEIQCMTSPHFFHQQNACESAFESPKSIANLARAYIGQYFIGGTALDSKDVLDKSGFYAVGFELLKIAADNNHPDSFFPLAVQYSRGIGLESAASRATLPFASALYKKAFTNFSKMSDMKNMLLLSFYRILGLSKCPQDPSEGFANLKYVTSLNYLNAVFLSAMALSVGFCHAADFRQSAELFLSLCGTSTSKRSTAEKQIVEKSKRLLVKLLQNDIFFANFWQLTAENGDSDAIYQVALCLLNGRGMKKDVAAALDHLDKASQAGHPGAQLDWALALLTQESNHYNPKQAFALILAVAEKNQPDAQAKLGEMYLRGIAPAEKDTAQAIRLLKVAASAQVPLAMFLLGECLELGAGIEANASEAAAWYGRAADKGHAESQYRYARCLEHGKGVTQDLNRAMEYYFLAAHSTHAGALAVLGRQYLFGIDGFQQNFVEAFRLLKSSAVGKDPLGMFLFGKMIIDHPNSNVNPIIQNCCISGFTCRPCTTRMQTSCHLCGCAINEAHLACAACNFDICRGCESKSPSLQDMTATVVRRRSFFMEIIQSIGTELENNDFIPERDVDLSKSDSFYLTSLTEFGRQPVSPTKFDSSIPNYDVERFISANCRHCMQTAEELLKVPSFLLSTGNPDIKFQEAVRMIESAAVLGVVEAQYVFALYLGTGFHISPDPERSFSFLSKAASANHSEAQAKLGEMYLRGIAPAEKDTAQAIRLLKVAASAQVPLAMFLLGECLELGAGIEANASEAAAWYGRAADKGHAESQYRYARCLEHGKGVTQDLNRAMEYYTLASRAGHVLSQSRLAKHLQTTDIVQAVKLYRSAAAGGDSNSQYDLAVLLLTGYGPVPKDTKNEFEAVTFFTNAAQQNHPRASYYLGCCRGIGLGCSIDVQESRKLLDFAVKHEIAAAMYDLAVSFSKSNDMKSALPLFQEAYKAKYPEASYALATLHFHGQGVDRDLPSVYTYFQAGCEQDSARCLFGFAYCLLHGVGTEPDVPRGLVEMEKCARQGNPFAQFFMGMCLKVGRGIAVDNVASTYWFRLSARQGFANSQKMMLCAFKSDETFSPDEIANSSVFLPSTHIFSLQLTSAAYYENSPNKGVLHRGTYEKTKGYGGMGFKFAVTKQLRAVEMTDAELQWKDPLTSEAKGSLAAQNAMSVVGGLIHNENYGIGLQFRNAKKNGKVSMRYFWSKNLKTTEALQAALQLWISSFQLQK